MDSAASAEPRTILDKRRAGALLHLTSLPSGGLGDAERFLEWLKSAGFSVWQMLPLGPSGSNNSPYSPISAFAGDPALMAPGSAKEQVSTSQLRTYREREQAWLEDYALFCVIRKQHDDRPWWLWPEALRKRHKPALKTFAFDHAEEIEHCMAQQFLFDRAWEAFRNVARQKDILLFGDMPMFVIADSADVWSRPHLFHLDAAGHPNRVAGAPPDAFTELGQCWNNPVYNWEALRREGFDWWLQRLEHECKRFDLLRWDHFRGLVAGWEIPVNAEQTAVAANGTWQEVPGRELLTNLWQKAGPLPIVAENLGVITSEVENLRHDFNLPGMHVLQFAFDGSENNPHLPECHEVNAVVYTGTHDNDTTLGWFESLDEQTAKTVLEIVGQSRIIMPDAMIQAALDSPCKLAVIPMQDLLGLDSSARMNIPGQALGQWSWRFSWQQATSELAIKWRQSVVKVGR
ncbi:MAG: 4-alpha-glucanotransferase [Lysobacterales bacterium]|jgi:4-alpha-glucanotransferase